MRKKLKNLLQYNKNISYVNGKLTIEEVAVEEEVNRIKGFEVEKQKKELEDINIILERSEKLKQLRIENESYRTRLFEDNKNFELKLIRYQEKLDREYKQKKLDVESEFNLKLIEIERNLIDSIKSNEITQRQLIENGVKQELIERINVEKSIILNSIENLKNEVKGKK